MDKNTGGAAFPSVDIFTNEYDLVQTEQIHGMTLRDYFAAKAMAAIISKNGKDGSLCGSLGAKKLSFCAYEYADEMLEARDDVSAQRKDSNPNEQKEG